MSDSRGTSLQALGGRDPAPLARVVVVLVWIYVGATVLDLLANLAGMAVMSEALDDAFTLVAVGAILQLVVLLISGFFGLKWIYRAALNTRVQGVDISPGWAIGWYFVPIASLWKPFEYMSKIWRFAEDPAGWKTRDVAPFMRVWWGGWLANTILSNASGRLGEDAYVASSVLAILGDIAAIVAGVLFIRIVREVTAKQISRSGIASVFD